MKFILSSILFISIITTSFAQPKFEWSEKFDYNQLIEKQPALVLADNYNTFLFSHINEHGILSNHKLMVRKFDQKNQLLETITQEFPKIDAGTLYNYLGFVEVNSNQLTAYTESYSGKEKKQDIHQHVFEKTTGKFTTSLLVSFPMESVMKKGTVEMSASENKRFVVIANMKNSTKKEVAMNEVVMVDATSSKVLWNKSAELGMKNTERSLTVTNGGKAVLLRADKGFVLRNFLTIVTADKQEDLSFDEEVQLHHPKAISIGSQDYLVDFNHNCKGLRAGNFEKFMLYDLSSGKILKNTKVTEFNSSTITAMDIRNIFIQNNEIHLFVEAKIKAGTRPVKANAMSTMTFDEPFYKFGNSALIVMNYQGEILRIKPISSEDNAMAELHHSFGVVNIMGKYFINGGLAYGIHPLPTETKTGDLNKSLGLYHEKKDPFYNISSKYACQLFQFIPDSKKLIIFRTHGEDKMSIVNVLGFE
jgi:hypothetical protein